MEMYQKLVERIAHAAKLSAEDIERKVEAKRAKLSGLVSKEGACQIVAAELGVALDKERMKLAELIPGMRRANVLGKVLEIGTVRSYTKGERSGKVANFTLADESGKMRCVLWDLSHVGLIEEGKLHVGDVVEITNANVRNGELHLSSFSDVRASQEQLGEVVTEAIYGAVTLKDARVGELLQTRAFIVQAFEPRYFEVCPECGRKAVEEACLTHGKVVPQRRALLNLVLDDGTETMRSVLFGETILQLGLSEEEVFSLEKFAEKRAMLLGEESVFSGRVRMNTLSNMPELTIEKVEAVQPEALTAALEGVA